MQSLSRDDDDAATAPDRKGLRSRAKEMGGTKSHILILCGDADGNLGDFAILKAICQALGTTSGAREVCIISLRPEWQDSALAIRTIAPGPRGFLQLCAAAARSDLVICGGGGLFQDDDSLIKMPYWGLRVVLVRLLGGRVVAYALGVGPLKAPSSKLFARLAFACMEKISVRDQKAKDECDPLTHKPVQVVPDPALLLQASPSLEARNWLEKNGVELDGRPLIGITTRRWFPARPRLIPHRVMSKFRTDRTSDDPAATRYLSLIARVLDQIAQRHDAQVLFLPTYNLQHEGDDQICRRIAGQMTWNHSHILTIDQPELYKSVVRELAVLVTGRMHPAIFAAAVGTPFVALAYNQKFHGFCELMEQQHRVFDVESLVADDAVNILCKAVEEALADNRDALRQRASQLGQQVKQYNASLLEML